MAPVTVKDFFFFRPDQKVTSGLFVPENVQFPLRGETAFDGNYGCRKSYSAFRFSAMRLWSLSLISLSNEEHCSFIFRETRSMYAFKLVLTVDDGSKNEKGEKTLPTTTTPGEKMVSILMISNDNAVEAAEKGAL